MRRRRAEVIPLISIEFPPGLIRSGLSPVSVRVATHLPQYEFRRVYPAIHRL